MTTTNNIYVNIYLTNLGKYTEGYLIGKWITLSTAINWKEELRGRGGPLPFPPLISTFDPLHGTCGRCSILHSTHSVSLST